MTALKPRLLTLTCWVILLGCSGGSHKSSETAKVTNRGKPSIIGNWTTSTAPELADSATTMRFLDSGEFFRSGPFQMLGKTVTYKDEKGNDRVAPFRGSGTWKQEGNKLRIEVTQDNVDNFKVDPTVYQIESVTDRKCVLDREGEKFTLFRVEKAKGEAVEKHNP